MKKQSPLIPPSPDYQDEEYAEVYAKAKASGKPLEDDTQWFATQDPFELFAQWLTEAKKKEINDPNAMSIATVDEDGMPDVRMVLLKDVDRDGFVFYTNTTSAKGKQLDGQPKAALCFHWKSLRRQVRVRGHVSRVSDAEADEYFASRHKDSQIGAWASDQSSLMEGRFQLEANIAKYAAKYALGKTPRPDHWTGYRIVPQHMEFWRDRPFRLHDRLVFDLGPNNQWVNGRLFP
jgi:pyridoxamine 5'-phosphate oxidase